MLTKLQYPDQTYDMSDLYGDYWRNSQGYSIPPTSDSLLLLFSVMLVYLALAWILGYALGSDFGEGRHIMSILLPSDRVQKRIRRRLTQCTQLLVL